MYDILPVTFPEYFPPTSNPLFKRWLGVIATYAKGVVCISHTVKDEFSTWLKEHHSTASLEVKVFPLGADIDNSHPTKGISQEQQTVLQNLENKPYALIVGTIEPRKGHFDIIKAFEHLWKDDEATALVIVGKQGWMVESCIESIKHSSFYGKKLFWLDKASDELLDILYKKATLLIAASYAEGFGLPIIEAAQKRIPIVARDIPVFREVGEGYADYFSNTKDETILAKEIKKYLQKDYSVEKKVTLKIMTWKESTEKLLESIALH